ncbi:response regulator, partial [Vibrio parahaemolyticus V-223/04]
LKLAQI